MKQQSTLELDLPIAGGDTWASRVSRKLLFRALDELRQGQLVLVEGTSRKTFGQAGDDLRAELTVLSSRFYTSVVTGGSIGAGEAFVRGEWTADSLTNVVRILVRNREVLSSVEGGWAKASGWLNRLLHRLKDNRRRRSKANIAAHYDLGNDFFELFLDSSMMYSCALFASPESSLHQASQNKLDVICAKLELGVDDRVVEIGTGWGGFALHAARHYGCQVVTTTISEQQFVYASERVRSAGLEHQIEVLKLDYRDLPRLGRRFDKLVSIEMIEAVGEKHLPHFFRVCSELLEPHGLMLLQAITIADALYEDYRKSADFIQRYIFPGGFLPSISAMMGAVAGRTDLQLCDLEDLTAHYAETLARWQTSLCDQHSAFLELGYPQSLYRMWNYYFSYCQGGFLERTVGDVQMLFSKPQALATAPLGVGVAPPSTP